LRERVSRIRHQSISSFPLQEIAQMQKSVTGQELKVEQKKEMRHSLLQQCKMEDIPLPFKKGAMRDIEDSSVSGFILETVDFFTAQ